MAVTKKRAHSATVLAETMGWDVKEMQEHRYHFGRTLQPVFTISERYFAVSAKKPKGEEEGLKWEEYRDQFFAKSHGTVVWVANMLEGEEA